MEVRYALSFESREIAEEAAAKLTDIGLRVSVDEHVYVDAPAASVEAVDAMRQRLQLFVDESSGDFLGNGSFARISLGDHTR